MIDSIMIIAAGFSALILIFFCAGAAVSFLPALAIYCGQLWMAAFRWMLRALGTVLLFGIVVGCIIIVFS